MNTLNTITKSDPHHPFLGIIALTCVLALIAPAGAAEATWPGVEPLEGVGAAEDTAPLPRSIKGQVMDDGQWACTFRFQPRIEAQSVVVAGSFNGWDRHANPLTRSSADGAWVGKVVLPTGMHEYKFLVNDEEWFDDPLNLDRLPDSFGGYNSIMRLGRLARMQASPAKKGDGKIDTIGLAHRPSLPLFIQSHGADRLLVRYRTLANDVEGVWLSIDGIGDKQMQVVSRGPLFTYWELEIAAPDADSERSPNVRSLRYTFVLQDGDARVGDPNVYHHSFTVKGVFETPEWARHAIWYQVMLDRFANGDTSNDPDPVRPWTSAWFEPSPWEKETGADFYGYAFERFYGGDIAGLEARLPYLKELGVNAIYLNPIFKGPSYHNYDLETYLHVDDHFGTVGDYEKIVETEDLNDPSTWKWTESDKRFIAFLEKAHSMGFKVIIDGVFNHVGDHHPAYKSVQELGRKSPYADWFDVISWEPLRAKGWADFTHMPVFRKSPGGFACPAVKKHLFAITQRWMDPNGDGDPSDGIDGWRLDVPNDIPRPFWGEWRRFVKKINPDALITGEIWHRADQWLDGYHFDAVMNYQFAKVAVNWIIDRDKRCSADEAASRLAELRLAYPAAATYALQNLVDGHDTDRLASMALNPDRVYDRQNRVQDNNPGYSNDKPGPEEYARARLVALLQMTYIGAPMIYYGDEVGMWGADDPSNRKPMLWQDLQPYDQPDDNVVMADQLAFYKQIISLRNKHEALRVGTFDNLLIDSDADVWAFIRTAGEEHVIVVLNASEEAREVTFELPEGAPSQWAIELDGGDNATAEGGKLAVEVPAIGGVVLSAEN